MSDTDQKAQKLATAIYLITGFFADQEPLKWKLRSLSTDLVVERVKDKFNVATEILTLFGIAQGVGLVSHQNFEILSKELNKFGEGLESPLNGVFFAELTPIEKVLPALAQQEVVKDKTPERLEKSAEEKPFFKDFGAVSVKKNSRQSIIIGLLKRKKEIMIKDVSSLIHGCSEKTIQRELLAMVEGGILKKIGEKRWSRYTLA